MTPAEIRRALASKSVAAGDAFKILQAISQMLAINPNSSEAHSLLIRSLEQREAFKGFDELLNALLRETGLYPYADPERLTARDRLALEFHRPEGILGDSGIVFHRVQAQIYRDLLDGNNVILSAPTSFGKSLIIDAVIASGKNRRIVIVVPTIALIDETRKRLTRFADRYKIITHASQKAAADGRGAIFVLTQERVVERDDLEDIDFFVIDEFYKLDPSGGGADRASILNHAFYKLLRSAKQFYLLGPNIRSVPIDFRDRYEAKLVVSDFETVVSDVQRVDTRGGREPALIRLASRIDGPALIYCQSPNSVRKVAELLVDEKVTPQTEELADAVAWVGRHFHPNWIVTRALARGVGVHHGRIPRSLAQLNVRLFNEGKLKFLVCTSTLIEGVNTAARHVVIYDNKVARTRFDYFTYRNIQGRSGRMFRHFVGTVHLFHEPPEPDLLDVDFPAFSQGDNAPDTLLVQLETEDLESDAAKRVRALRAQPELSFETIRANQHVDPTVQIELARYIRLHSHTVNPFLRWRGEPSNDDLYKICDLLWDTLLDGVGRDSVRSAKQLAFLLSQLRGFGSASRFIQERVQRVTADAADDGVENALDFLRTWASFHFPRALVALERIQQEVFSRLGLPSGSYAAFAVRVENLFLPPALAALEEYGLPLQIVERIARRLGPADSLDDVLERLRRTDPAAFGLPPFETRLLQQVQDTL